MGVTECPRVEEHDPVLANAEGQLTATLQMDAEDVPMAANLLEDLAGELVQARVDLTQYAETYYFRDGEESASLAATIRTALHLAHAAEQSPRADMRFAGKLLDGALGDFARLLDDQFLRVGGSPQTVFTAYAADHGHAPAVMD